MNRAGLLIILISTDSQNFMILKAITSQDNNVVAANLQGRPVLEKEAFR